MLCPKDGKTYTIRIMNEKGQTVQWCNACQQIHEIKAPESKLDVKPLKIPPYPRQQ